MTGFLLEMSGRQRTFKEEHPLGELLMICPVVLRVRLSFIGLGRQIPTTGCVQKSVRRKPKEFVTNIPTEFR